MLISLILPLVLAVIYLIGGLSFTGEIVVLTSGNENFTSIALSMSALGFAAGLLVPTTQVQEFLEKSLKK